MSTVALVAATRAAVLKTWSIASERPTMFSSAYLSRTLRFSSRFSAASRRCCRARPTTIWIWSTS
jgi:hypothetical protein